LTHDVLRFSFRFRLTRIFLPNNDVWFNALCLNRATRRGVVAPGCEPQGTLVREWNDRLYRPLTEGTCAHDRCPVIVLERTGNNLRGRCRSAITSLAPLVRSLNCAS